MAGDWTEGVGVRRSVCAVRLFMHDQSLLRGVRGPHADMLRQGTLVRALRLGPGRVPTPLLRAGPEDVGFLVLRGFLVQRVEVGKRWASEVVGPSDVLLPARADATSNGGGGRTEWHVRKEALLAILDRRFAQGPGAHPAIVAELLERMATRTRRQTQQLALARLPRMDDRVLALLWMLASHFGDASMDRAELVLPVTQETLAELTGSSRQAVNGALQRLREHGAVVTGPGGRWRLQGEQPAWVA